MATGAVGVGGRDSRMVSTVAKRRHQARAASGGRQRVGVPAAGAVGTARGASRSLLRVASPAGVGLPGRLRPCKLSATSIENGKLAEGEGVEGRGVYWPYKVGAVVTALSLAVWKIPALNTLASSSGFTAAFSLIFVSEIGDKTFFLAALLAAQKSKALVLAGTMAALAMMSVISVGIGLIFQKLPSFFHSSVPVTEYLSVALLFFFGVQSLRSGFSDAKGNVDEELEDAKEELAKDGVKDDDTLLRVIVSTFLIIFAAEWGDRSMIATVALVASQSPVGVAFGSIAGHFAATLIAIVGGAMVSKHLSERVLKIAGGALFLLIGVGSLAGVF